MLEARVIYAADAAKIVQRYGHTEALNGVMGVILAASRAGYSTIYIHALPAELKETLQHLGYVICKVSSGPLIDSITW